MSREPAVARALWQRLELIHAVTYFAPEATGALTDAGYRGFWMGYFAGRAAPLGPAGPEIVSALFYNFAPARVKRALPDAWTFAPPEAALAARLNGSVSALRRMVERTVHDRDISTAAELASRAASSAPLEGRALYAANRALPWPQDPLAVLWHAATLLREHRGDGHVAALTAAGIGGRAANVVQSAAGVTPRSVFVVARDYDDTEWTNLVADLTDRGLLTSAGALSAAGWDVKNEIERRTDMIAESAYEDLDDGEVARLIEALSPIARAVQDAGDIPAVTPIGIPQVT